MFGLLHHVTTFWESYSITILKSLVLLFCFDNVQAICIAFISASLISEFAILIEKIHLTLPCWSLKTPPISVFPVSTATKASGFHLNHPLSDGLHSILRFSSPLILGNCLACRMILGLNGILFTDTFNSGVVD